MPQVRITRNTVVNRVNVRVGDVVSVSVKDAVYLVQLGKAELVSAAETESPPAAPPAAEHRPAVRQRRNKPTHEVSA